MLVRPRPAAKLVWNPGLWWVLANHQLRGWREAQGSHPKQPLRLEKTAVGSGMSWRATVAAPPDGCPARPVAEWPLGVPWVPAEAEDHGRSGSARRRRENAH